MNRSTCFFALLCVFLFCGVSISQAHDAAPQGSVWVVLGDQFKVHVFADLGENCNAFFDLSLSDPLIAGVVGEETKWVREEDYFLILVNPTITGTTTLSMRFMGEDTYYNRPEGDCHGEAIYTLVLNVTEPPTGVSSANNPFSGTSNDPVNTGSGELFFHEPPDLNLGGPLALYFQRYFASYLRRDFIVGDLGDNWRHNFEWRIHWVGNTLLLVDDEGRAIRYNSDGSGGWKQQSNVSVPYQLIQKDKEIYVHNPLTNLFYTFNPIGQLSKIEDGKGNALTLTYVTWTGKLYEVADGLGRKLRFHYGTYGSNLRKLRYIEEVQENTVRRSVSFYYDTKGDLLQNFYDADGYATLYTYHPPDGADRANLKSKQLPMGNIPYTQTYYTTLDGVDSGKVKTQTDANGNTHTFTYSGAATVMTDPKGVSQSHVHDQAGSLASHTDKTGLAVTFGSDSTGRRNSIIDRMGSTTSYTYNQTNGKVESIINADGSKTTFTYAPRSFNGFAVSDLISRIAYPDGTSEAYLYDAYGNLLSRTNREGNSWTYTYNARSQVLTSTNPLMATTTFAYNTDGTLKSVTDNAGHATSFAYDVHRRLISQIHPDATTRNYTYDRLDHLLSVTDERGHQVNFIYDYNGNLYGHSDPDSQLTEFRYDSMDHLTSVTDPLGNSVSRTYDELGRPATFTDQQGNTMTFQYDSRGRMISLTDKLNKVWDSSFDAEGIIKSASNPLSELTQFDSDSMGRLTKTTDPQGGSTNFTYDGMGRVTAVQDAKGNITVRSYNAMGRLTGINLQGTAIGASYTYNALGQITSISDPLGNAWRSSYDTQGRLTSLTDPLGRATTVSYNNRNWVSNISYPASAGSVSITYDGIGNATRRVYSADNLAIDYTFDAMNRLTTANGISLSYDMLGRVSGTNGISANYDAAGLLQSLTLASGKALTYAYDTEGRTTAITDWLGGVTEFTYDATGKVLTMSRPNGVTTTYTYNKNGKITGIQNGNLANISLSRDAKGMIVSVTGNSPTPVSQLPTDTRNNTFDNSMQAASSTYDSLGRLTRDGLRSYTWDGASRLSSYTEGGNAVSFAYDAYGQRISRTAGSVTRNYVWNYALGKPSISVEQSGGADVRYYIHTVDGTLLYSIDAVNQSRQFYHYDEMGNTQFLTDDNASVIATYSYSPYGEILGSSGSIDNLFTYRGSEGIVQEGNSGLYYNRARYYDSVSGRFITKEPAMSMGPRSINPYQYALGNPTFYSDPSGLYPEANGPFPPGLDLADSGLLPGEDWQSDSFPRLGFTSYREAVRDKAPGDNFPLDPSPVSTGGNGPGDTTSDITQHASACPSYTRLEMFTLGAGTAGEVAERGFTHAGRQAIQRGLAGGSFAGAATNGMRAAGVKAAGAALSAGIGAYSEATQAMAEGQSTGTVVVRSVWSGATDAAVTVASGPLAIADTATGSNFSNSIKMVGRVGTTLAGNSRDARAYERAVRSGDYGALPRITNNAGEAWAQEGFFGMLGKLYDCYTQ